MTSQELWPRLVARLAELEEVLPNVHDAGAWLASWSDIEKEVYEIGAVLYRNHYADTSNAVARDALDTYLTTLAADIRTVRARLTRNFVTYVGEETDEAWAFVVQTFRDDVARHADENDALTTRELLESKNYTSIVNEARVALENESLTLAEARARLQSPDRAVRERIYRAVVTTEIALAPRLTDLFMELLTVRHALARNVGAPNFHDFAWRRWGRTSYTPEDVRAFRDVVRAEVVPTLHHLREVRRELLKLDKLQPWDVQPNPFAAELRPRFSSGADLVHKMKTALQRVDTDLASRFSALVARGDADVERRPSKAARSYSDYKTALHQAMLFISAVPRPRTVHTLAHEIGHAVHFEAIPSTDLVWNLFPPKEFKEFVAQSMEVLTLPHLADADVRFYERHELPAVTFLLLERALTSIVNSARTDAFQEWVYTTDEASPRLLDEAMQHLYELFSPEPPSTEFAAYHATRWQVQNVFQNPLYQIEYALAWLGTLTLWRRRDEGHDVLSSLKDAMSLGARPGVRALYEHAGIGFDFSRAYVRDTMIFVREHVKKLTG